ncbi:MAG: hypothetical protein JEZ06_18730 [Anaerolineaceae bacterium]|nr:hypothetical protein [Anaerolineaceae bacterium]
MILSLLYARNLGFVFTLYGSGGIGQNAFITVMIQPDPVNADRVESIF